LHYTAKGGRTEFPGYCPRIKRESGNHRAGKWGTTYGIIAAREMLERGKENGKRERGQENNNGKLVTAKKKDGKSHKQARGGVAKLTPGRSGARTKGSENG